MKRSLIPLIMIFIVVLLTSQAYADVTTSGEVRVRCEYDSNSDDSFNKNDATVHETFLRTRFNINAEINDNASAFIQFQDSRSFGDPESGDVGDHGDVYLHQGYFTVNQLWNNGIGLKIGRFEVKLGNERVFGAVGWNNVGRVWDGMHFFYEVNNYDFGVYWLRPRDDFSVDENSDFDIYGITADLKPLNLELFGLLEKDAFEPVPPGDDNINQLDRISVGLYYYRLHKQFDFTLNGVIQTGNIFETGATEESDISAFMFAFEAGYSLEGEMNPRLAFGFDYASGDDDLNDDKYKTYDNLYYTGHKFHGFMDYFTTFHEAGLMDIMVRAKLNPFEGWTVKGDFHLFSHTADYTSLVDGERTKDAGSEFDLTVTTSNISGIKFTAGASMFMPKEDFAGMDDPETAFWYYLMMTAGF